MATQKTENASLLSGVMAWRNIWRNRLRSWVIIVAVALGIWAAIFMTGFAQGMVTGMVENTVSHITSHLQIHHPDYLEDPSLKAAITPIHALNQQIKALDGIKAFASRTLVNGMIATSRGTRGVQIVGIQKEAESDLTQLPQKLTEGTYFEGKKRNPILIGKDLAEKLKLKIRSKVVLNFQNRNGTVTAGAFRVVGFYDKGNEQLNESQVYVDHKDLNRLLGHLEQPIFHELAVLLGEGVSLVDVQSSLKEAHPDLSIQNYGEVSPDLKMYESQMGISSAIYLGIIMLALIFGIINTMLMAVLERYRELGMLMAIGMNKRRVFFMIMLETLLLSLIGAPIGLLLGVITAWYFGTYGIDLSSYSDALKQFGMNPIIYFKISQSLFWQVPISISITAILASIYPALKAISLKPVEAIRKL